MAVTVNPAVSRVGKHRAGWHIVGYVTGVALGCSACAGVAIGVVRFAGTLPVAEGILVWSTVVLLGLGALRDVGAPVPVPYPAKQVPEWWRQVLPPGVVALAFGAILGLGFLTRFTTSAHLTFVGLAAMTQPSGALFWASCASFALGKSVVLAVTVRAENLADLDRLSSLGLHPKEKRLNLMKWSIAMVSVCTAVLLLTY